MIILVFFDWNNSGKELKRWNNQFKEACEDHGMTRARALQPSSLLNS